MDHFTWSVPLTPQYCSLSATKPSFGASLVGEPVTADERFNALVAEKEHELASTDLIPLACQDTVRRGSGVYVLHYADYDLTLHPLTHSSLWTAYIGTGSIRGRLSKHHSKITEATRLDVGHAFYRYIICNRHFAKGVESVLFTHYEPLWQHEGFGSNVHGKGRPAQRQSIWDRKYGVPGA